MLPATLFVLAILAGLQLYARWRAEQPNDDERIPTHSLGRPNNCPRCGQWKPAQFCPDCHWPNPPLPGTPERVLKALQERIQRLATQELLPADVIQRLSTSVQAERQRLDEVLAAQAMAAAPEDAPLPVAESAAVTEAPILAVAIEVPALPVTTAAAPTTAPSSGEYAVTPQPDVVARAQHYAEQRAAVLASAPVLPARPKTPPRANLGDLLATFMEERNVRWGELIGGLLIVGGSIALVISFWAEIAARTLLKFGLFNGIAAALFGLGFYTHRKWKLPTTSRGVLVIATALIPLNFLTIAAFTRGAAANDPLVLAGEAASIAVFLLLTYAAGKLIATPAPAALAWGVLGGSAVQLLMRRWVDADASAATLLSLGGLALAAHVSAMGVGLWRAAKESELAEPTINALFRLLGLTAFAALAPGGLLVKLTGEPAVALQKISPLVALVGVPTLATGLFLYRRLTQSELSGLRTAGTALAVLGAGVMLGGAWLAWPEPARLVAVGLLDAVALTVVAIAYGISASHFLAAAALALAFTVGLAAAAGQVSWFDATTADTVRAVCTARTGNLLTIFAAAYAGGAALWQRRGRAGDARAFAAIAAAVAALSLTLISLFGFRQAGDPYGATWMYAGYALATAAAAIVIPWSNITSGRFTRLQPPTALGWLASAMAALAVIQGVVHRPTGAPHLASPWTTALIIHGTLALIAGLLIHRWRPLATLTARALVASSLVTTSAAAVHVSYDVWRSAASTAGLNVAAQHTLALAVLWLLAAIARRSGSWFTAAQGACFACASLAVGAQASGAAWHDAGVTVVADPAFWLRVACVWAAICLGWLATRLTLCRMAPVSAAAHDGAPLTGTELRSWLARCRQLLRPVDVALDELFAGLTVVALLGLTTLTVMPDVIGELLPAPVMTPAVELADTAAATDIAGDTDAPAPLRPMAWSLARREVRGAHVWPLWALLVALVTLGHGEGKAYWRSCGLLLTLSLACPLAASGFASSLATASAWRWMAAGAFCLGAGVYSQRRPLAAVAARLRLGGSLLSAADASVLWSVLTAAPVLLISAHRLAVALWSQTLAGPGAGWPANALGIVAEAAAPLGLIAAATVALAVLRRSANVTFLAGTLVNGTVSLAYVLATGLTIAAAANEHWIGLVQANILAVVVFGGLWLAWMAWRRRNANANAPLPLVAYVGIGCTLELALLFVANALMYDRPQKPPAWLTALSGPAGLGSLLGSFGLALWIARDYAKRVLAAVTTVAVCSAAICAACSASAWDSGNWLTSHVHLIGFSLAPWAVLALGWRRLRGQKRSLTDASRASVTRWTTAAGAVAFCLALRLVGRADPQQPWWSIAAVGVLALLAVALASWSCRRRYVYLAAALINTAIVLALPSTSWWNPSPTSDVRFFTWLFSNVLAMAAPVAAWLWLERYWIAPHRAATPTPFYLPAHRPLAWGAVLLMALATALGVLSDYDGGHGLATEMPLRYATLAAVGIAALALFWDVRAREAGAVLYLFGLVLVGTYIDRLNLVGDRLVWAGVMGLAAFTLASSYVWSRRARFFAAGARFKLPAYEAQADDAAPWLVLLNLAVISAVVTLAYWAELAMPNWPDRFSAGQAAVVQAFSLGMLARGRLRPLVQNFALAVGALGLVAVGWSWVEHGRPLPILSYSIATATALVGTAVVYGLAFAKLPKRAGDWPLAAVRATPWVVLTMATCLVLVLGQEAALFAQHNAVQVTSGEIGCVAAALLALFAAALAAALLPGRDPFDFSETGRMAYVYAAEVVLALLFLHVRVTLPWLFSGRFLAYWPLIVMGIAFLGVGLGEWFGRRRQNVLAKPLERTGALLPLLPVLGFWFVQTQTHYSLLLLVVGGLYAALAVTRKSFGFGLLAALSTNGSLWYYLHHVGGFGLFEHPQLWLIPPALSVLAAAYLNRDRLSPTQMTNVRYLTSTTIYLSSTAEIFLHGVAQAPWSPLVLAGLAIVGVFAGIVLRVRAFLFLGTAFLGLAVMTVVWHAAVDRHQTWIWFASAIVMGLAILTMFALFEKKREDVLRLMGELKQWQP